jgi:hypothetical protein
MDAGGRRAGHEVFFLGVFVSVFTPNCLNNPHNTVEIDVPFGIR